jgi:predicted NBD/HSP70 family sugar kinase
MSVRERQATSVPRRLPPRKDGNAISTAAARSTLVPADMRLANLTRIIQELRSAGGLSRSDVARRVGMSLPTAHRLVSDLADLGLVAEENTAADGARLGRPPVVYSFREDAALLAGVDAGNETTRLALTTLSGRVLAARALPSDQLGRRLPATLVEKIKEMLSSLTPPLNRLVGVGVGIAACVDSDGVLRDPPAHLSWDGLPLRESLSTQLRCEVAVAQDDHLSPIAESSDRGTFPGASSLLVLEIGRGIGVGMTLDGTPISGARGRFGRIAGWPVTDPIGGQVRTLGECLVTRGLVRQYHARGGTGNVHDGASLAAAARDGDRQAQSVLGWAAIEIADVVTRLQQLCDPEAIVIGGGLARAHDLLEPVLARWLPPGVRAARSVLGEQAVVVGAVIVAGSFVESWLSTRLARA